jgi:hypothetical protein
MPNNQLLGFNLSFIMNWQDGHNSEQMKEKKENNNNNNCLGMFSFPFNKCKLIRTLLDAEISLNIRNIQNAQNNMFMLFKTH